MSSTRFDLTRDSSDVLCRSITNAHNALKMNNGRRSTFRKNEALKCAVKDPDLAFDLICDTLERQRQDQEQLEPLMHVYNAPLHGSSSNKYSMPERRAVSKPKICLAMSSFLELRDPVVLPPWTPWLRFSMPMKAPRRQF